MSNSLLKYINNKGLGSGIDEVQEFTASNLPDLSLLPVGSVIAIDGELRERINNTNILYRKDKKKVAVLRFGQSNERGSAYNALYYTSSSIVGNGTTATLTTTIANNLIPGEKYIGSITGAVPAGLNVTNAIFTVQGFFPTCTLTYQCSITGTATTQGSLSINQEASYPDAYRSKYKPALRKVVPPAVTPNGGIDYKLYDDVLEETGVEIIPINANLGSMSFVGHAVGMPTSWQANYASFANTRAPQGPTDYGDMGTVIVKNDCLFQCVSGGRNRYATCNNGAISELTLMREIDYVISVPSVASPSTGSTEPTWSNASTVGSTITDGTVTWKNILVGCAAKGIVSGQPFVETQIGFDPLGLIRRAHYEGARIAAASNCTDRIVILSNGQADTANTAAAYKAALLSMEVFFRNKGWKVAIGFTCFTPTTSVAAYDALNGAVTDAITQANAFKPDNTIAGPNLYASLGSVPGINGLNLQSDNLHNLENVHLSATGIIAAGDVYSSWFIDQIKKGFI